MSKYQSLARGVSISTLNLRMFISKNKWKIYISLFVVLTLLLTGVFVAIKNTDSISKLGFDSICITKYLKGDLGSWGLFFERVISCVINIGTIAICSVTIYTLPLSFVFIGYKTYLIGASCTLLIICCSLGGLLSSLLIILPCQIASLAILLFFYFFSSKCAYNKKCYGNSGSHFFVVFLLTLLALIAVSFIETILLNIFSAKFILVI